MSRRSGNRSQKRREKVRVRTARGRTAQSTQWLARQLNDPYVQAAREAGYRSRAAYKLLEIDEKTNVLSAAGTVVDLGAAPGGWTQVAVNRAGKRGQVVALDILDMESVPGAEFLRADFLEPEASDMVRSRLGGPADVVLSDMAANTTGHAATDHLRIMALVEAAYAFAAEVLAPGGNFVAKVFKGGTEGELLKKMKVDFETVRHVKPPASRKESAETYVVARGFRRSE